MKRTLRFRPAAIALTATTLTLCTGCSDFLRLSHALFFGAGWLLRDLTVPTSTIRECYQNGQPIDCAEVL